MRSTLTPSERRLALLRGVGAKFMEAIKKIFSDYEGYSKGALEYYNSVDVEEIIRRIVE